MHLDHLGAERRRGQPRIDRAGMIATAHRAAVALRKLGKQVQADALGRTGIGRGALQHGQRDLPRPHALHRCIDLLEPTHPGREQDRETALEDRFEQRRVADFSRGDLPARDPDPAQEVHRLDRERRAQKQQTPGLGMAGETVPLLLGELHPPPVVEPCPILRAEVHPPRFGWGALGRRDVGLELHRSRAGLGDRVDERVRQAQAAVMRLGHLADDQAAPGSELHNWPPRGLRLPRFRGLAIGMRRHANYSSRSDWPERFGWRHPGQRWARPASGSIPSDAGDREPLIRESLTREQLAGHGESDFRSPQCPRTHSKSRG